MLEASFPPGGTGRSGPPRRGASLPGERDIRHSSRHADGLAFCAPHETKFPRRSPVEPACPFACSAMKQPGQSSMCLAMLFFTVRPARRKEELFVARRSEPKRNFPVAARPFPRAILLRKVFFSVAGQPPLNIVHFSPCAATKKRRRAPHSSAPSPIFCTIRSRAPSFLPPFRRTRSFFIYKHPG